jgi:hypothetical protein
MDQLDEAELEGIAGGVGWLLPLGIIAVAGALTYQSRRAAKACQARGGTPVLGVGLPGYCHCIEAKPKAGK